MKDVLKFLTRDRVIFSKRFTSFLSYFLPIFTFFFCLSSVMPAHFNVDPKIQPYVNEIIKLSKGNLGKKIKRIGFYTVKKENAPLAICNTMTNTISVNDVYWKYLSEWSKIMLIVHEIIHCECYIEHIIGLGEDFCPISIMHPYDGGDECNIRHKSKYIKEMQTIECD